MGLADALEELESVARGFGRPPPDLLAVSKYQSLSDIQKVYDEGQRRFGENYVQELCEKAPKLPQDILWVFIGKLQSNKINALLKVPNVHRINSIGNLELACKVNDACDNLHREVEILIQMADPETDVDIPTSTSYQLFNAISEKCPRLHVKGFMILGKADDPLTTKARFMFGDRLRTYIETQHHTAIVLSMGMSADFHTAIQAGTTEVRLGEKVFKPRPLRHQFKKI